jgi:hypothetical protein
MKLFLGLAAAYLFLMCALLVAVIVIKSRTVSFSSGDLTPVVFFAGFPTAAAVALQWRAWRSEKGFAAAVLTSLVAGLIVTGLLFVVSLAGG